MILSIDAVRGGSGLVPLWVSSALVGVLVVLAVKACIQIPWHRRWGGMCLSSFLGARFGSWLRLEITVPEDNHHLLLRPVADVGENWLSWSLPLMAILFVLPDWVALFQQMHTT